MPAQDTFSKQRHLMQNTLQNLLSNTTDFNTGFIGIGLGLAFLDWNVIWLTPTKEVRDMDDSIQTLEPEVTDGTVQAVPELSSKTISTKDPIPLDVFKEIPLPSSVDLSN